MTGPTVHLLQGWHPLEYVTIPRGGARIENICIEHACGANLSAYDERRYSSSGVAFFLFFFV